MLTVHHLNNSRSQRVLWLLEELGLPYEGDCQGSCAGAMRMDRKGSSHGYRQRPFGPAVGGARPLGAVLSCLDGPVLQALI